MDAWLDMTHEVDGHTEHLDHPKGERGDNQEEQQNSWGEQQNKARRRPGGGGQEKVLGVALGMILDRQFANSSNKKTKYVYIYHKNKKPK